ncbi:hypothetical protein CspeluHIS016_0500160 [Cutaneotrichosporon spelunceum]|uniref:Peptidase A1 domain-containing protein n=1 Tax=Cutaneotrichosporon spelunceum TaxID=1672016 RepID=A0AAD3YDJ6_9TREE|nr:hypothetical protein CspeluHIS016_0500160 [Cutaneotrichosporon spelunceum]
MLTTLPLLLLGAAASPAARLEPRLSPTVNATSIPIQFTNKTASVVVSAGTPPQQVSVQLVLYAGQLELPGFKHQNSSSFQDSPPRDNVQIGPVTLEHWEIEANDAGLEGTLPLGVHMPSEGNTTTDIAWALASKIPGKTFSLSIGVNDSTLGFGSEPGLTDWWNPIEDPLAGWSFIIDGLALDGHMVTIDDEPVPLPQTADVNGNVPAPSSSPGSSPSEIPPASPTGQPAKPTETLATVLASKRQATPATIPASTPISVGSDTATSASTPSPSTGSDGEPCSIICTLEYKLCMCAEGEMCRRHAMSCNSCPFLECVRNGTSSGTENCVACPAIYQTCDCGPDEDCVRTLASCKSCETVECRKRGSVTPANPQWEEPSVEQPSTAPTTVTVPVPSSPVPSGPQPPTCTGTVVCPAIYQLCSCHADETCVRQTRCDRCPWLECHKPAKPFPDDSSKCVQCSDVQPECNCAVGETCVREPRSCTDCGRVTCRTSSDPSLRVALSLDDEIAISPQAAKALQKLIPGMMPVSSAAKRAPTASATATPVSAGSDANNSAVSADAPPRPEGKTYYTVPCNTTAVITLVFPGTNYTLAAKDWVVRSGDGCQAALVMQDTLMSDVILGLPFLRTVRAAFRLNGTAQVAFGARNGTSGMSSEQGASSGSTSGAGPLGYSVAGVVGVIAAAACIV